MNSRGLRRRIGGLIDESPLRVLRWTQQESRRRDSPSPRITGLRFCAILSATISLLLSRIARNGLISETSSLLTASSSGESSTNCSGGDGLLAPDRLGGGRLLSLYEKGVF